VYLGFRPGEGSVRNDGRRLWRRLRLRRANRLRLRADLLRPPVLPRSPLPPPLPAVLPADVWLRGAELRCSDLCRSCSDLCRCSYLRLRALLLRSPLLQAALLQAALLQSSLLQGSLLPSVLQHLRLRHGPGLRLRCISSLP
jgi:hypothetical protein